MTLDQRAALFLSLLALMVLTAATPPTIANDAAIQLKALAQYFAGESPSINHLVEANPADLTTLTREWMVWWPPAPQLAVWPFAAAGLPLGLAVRVATALALLIGLYGWLRWWSLFELPRPLLLAVAILLPWRRIAANSLFEFSAEVLGFAAIPWVLVGAHALLARTSTTGWPSRPLALAAGAGAGALYWVQYSAVFVAVGFSVALFVFLYRNPTAWTRVLVPAGIGVAIPIVALSALNRQLGGAINMVDQSSGLHFEPIMLLYAVSNPALILADAGSLFNYVFTNHEHGLYPHPHVVAALGVPGGLTMAWLACKAATLPERIAAIVLAVSVGLMIPIWSIGFVSLEERHLAGGAAAMAPALFAIGRRRWPTWPAPLRGWLIAAVLAYVVAPWALYGPGLVLTKTWRTHDYVASPSALYVPVLSTADARAAVVNLRQACDVRPVVWYIPYPVSALEISGPMVLDEGLEPIEHVAAQRYRGRVAVCALLPPRFETSGKGAAIRASFQDIVHWRAVQVPEALDTLWIGRPEAP